jgi:hypothetical protein
MRTPRHDDLCEQFSGDRSLDHGREGIIYDVRVLSQDGLSARHEAVTPLEPTARGPCVPRLSASRSPDLVDSREPEIIRSGSDIKCRGFPAFRGRTWLFFYSFDCNEPMHVATGSRPSFGWRPWHLHGTMGSARAS